MLVNNALYLLNISGTAFRDLLSYKLDAMGYKPCYTDPDIWLRPALKTDSFEYYEYILCYVDDVLCLLQNPRKSMKRNQEDFRHKGKKIEPPGVYPGA